MKKRIKQKDKYQDDGQTVANMNVEGLPWYMSEKQVKAKKKMLDLGLSSKERRAIAFGAFLAYLPLFLTIIAGFVGAYLLIALLFF
jgi:hypothetical protein